MDYKPLIAFFLFLGERIFIEKQDVLYDDTCKRKEKFREMHEEMHQDSALK